jgi:hypothetical protein
VGTIALVVIFHEEIRGFFKNLGSRRYFKYISAMFSRKGEQDIPKTVMPVVMACISMAQQ